MQVKIDTRAKLHVITIHEPSLAANMTADLDNSLLPMLQNDVKNVVLNLKDIKTMDIAAAEHLLKLQQVFYEQNASFVVCALSGTIESMLEEAKMLELFNATPTQIEAIDLVNMEEIERELLGEE